MARLKEEYDKTIDNMNKYINIKHIAMLRNHEQEEWPNKMAEMKQRIPQQLHWVLEDDFYEIYKMNVHLIENRKIMAMYNNKSKKMYENIKNIINNESKLWEYLLCSGGSVTQQNMTTIITACILQCKTRYEIISSYEAIST